MSEERYFPAWSKTDCDECGCEFQVTRTEPKTTSKVICSDCDAYFRGYYDGRLEIESLQSQVEQLQNENSELNNALIDMRASLRTCSNTSTFTLDQYKHLEAKHISINKDKDHE